MSKKEPAVETNEEYEIELSQSFAKKKEAKISNQTDYSKELQNKLNIYNRIVDLYENNIKEDQKMRKFYAKILISILIVELIVLMVVFILNGGGVLQYSDVTLNIFITGGIAEVFVLVKLIVEYLFKDNLTNALNIILKNNKNIGDKKSNENNTSYKN